MRRILSKFHWALTLTLTPHPSPLTPHPHPSPLTPYPSLLTSPPSLLTLHPHPHPHPDPQAMRILWKQKFHRALQSDVERAPAVRKALHSSLASPCLRTVQPSLQYSPASPRPACVQPSLASPRSSTA